MSWTLEGRPLRSILISRLRYLGDVVMATPLLEVLRKGDPKLKLGFLAEKNHGQVLQGHPHLNRLHLLDTTRRGADARARSGGSNSMGAVGARSMVNELTEGQYDLAVDLFFNPRSAWLLALAGIRHRIGGTRGSRRLLYSHTIIPSEDQKRTGPFFKIASGGMGEHLARLSPLVHAETNLTFGQWFVREYEGQFISPYLPRKFWDDKFEPGNYFKDQAFEQAPIVLAPGATWSTKEWPFEHWKQLTNLLLESTDRPLLVIQPPVSEQWSALGEFIPANRGRVMPVMDLSQVLSLISGSALLVSVDGGIMHAGVGLRIPTIGLFGPTDPELWFPYEKAGPYKVMTSNAHCAPCDLHQCDQFICLPELSPNEILEQCLLLIDRGGE